MFKNDDDDDGDDVFPHSSILLHISGRGEVVPRRGRGGVNPSPGAGDEGFRFAES